MGYYQTDRGSISLIASATELASNNVVVDTTALSDYTCIKTIRITYPVNPASVLRFTFELQGDGAKLCYGKVYRNGVAIGVEKSEIGGGFSAKSDDITFTDLCQNDLLQLYSKVESGCSSGRVQNFKVCGTPVFTPFESVF